jgi:hypothetical protein
MKAEIIFGCVVLVLLGIFLIGEPNFSGNAVDEIVKNNCQEGWKCLSKSNTTYQNPDCSLTGNLYCENGCDQKTGNCIEKSKCTPKWKCVDKSTANYQKEDCSFTNKTTCKLGCNLTTGQCSSKTICLSQWKCLDKWNITYQNSDCSLKNLTYCSGGCSENICKKAPEGNISAFSDVNGVNVYVDNALKGTTKATGTAQPNLIIHNIPVGSHTIKFTKSGYYDYTLKVKVSANGVVKSSVKMKEMI